LDNAVEANVLAFDAISADLALATPVPIGQSVRATEYDRNALTMTETRARIETLEDALAAVAKVGPVARENAQKCEDSRRMAPEVIDAIADAGLWRAFGPKAIGDAGLGGVSEQFEILRALTHSDLH
jgi:alkylation response protein AidB-like acyl-CoA dehydrogenase